MTQLKVKRILLDEDNNDLIKTYLPANYLEIKEIKDLPKQHRKFVKEVYYTVYSKISYAKLVNQLVKERYSDSEEFAILRKAINNGITEEYQLYNAYVEECKERAKAFIEKRTKALNK